MISTLFYTMALFGPLLLSAGPVVPNQSSPDRETTVYHYRMKGKVRLLLFWVGKDNVGGGQISVGRMRTRDGTSDSVEVFFGSNPERVPGGINRWGYGQETARWIHKDGSTQPVLQETLFEGFMKHSQEEGLSEVMAAEEEAKSGEQYWYEGTRSLVRPEQAVSELRKFSTRDDFDYLRSQSIRCQYEKRLLAKPDKNRQLINEDIYDQPFGFLTAVHAVIRSSVEEYSESGRLNRNLSPLPYIYNAQAYELSVRGRKLVRNLEIPDPGRTEPGIYPLVARVDFRVRKKSVSGHHDFTLWVPLEGDLRGIPVRILDRPRWWLGIELNLEAVEAGVSADKVTCE